MDPDNSISSVRTLYPLNECLSRVYSCLDPPSKEICAEYVIEALKQNAYINRTDAEKKKAYLKTMRRVKKLPPNKNWLLTVLFNLNPDHEVFSKTYRKPRQSKMNMYQKVEVVDTNGFFSDLRDAPHTKRRMVPGLTKEVKRKQKAATM